MQCEPADRHDRAEQFGDLYRLQTAALSLGFVDTGRSEHLKIIQEVISRLATCSFQLKGWVITLAAALQVFLKGEAHPVYLFVPALPVLRSGYWMVGTCAR